LLKSNPIFLGGHTYYQWVRNSVFQVLTQPTQSQIHTVISLQRIYE